MTAKGARSRRPRGEMRTLASGCRSYRFGVAGGAALAAWLCGAPAYAQQATFHLDRLEVWGSPDDGIGVLRPVTNDKPIFFGQLALGYSVNPLHTSTLTSDPATLAASSAAVIAGQ